jgi:hypothetical protein
MPRASAKSKKAAAAAETEAATALQRDLLDLDNDPYEAGGGSTPDLDEDDNSSDDEQQRPLPGALPLVPIRDNVYFPHLIFPLFHRP